MLSIFEESGVFSFVCHYHDADLFRLACRDIQPSFSLFYQYSKGDEAIWIPHWRDFGELDGLLKAQVHFLKWRVISKGRLWQSIQSRACRTALPPL